ncbi:unnamed protein product [Brachionus calyciflorus]|uniref:Vacuolar protein sorting-associated protein 45 n=1 Tax=Brachionus calyciflorus TaxID=104777 RepID=A0A813QW35_9BILA|nr:unnamed protein product [Brachionus calyciflorus]
MSGTVAKHVTLVSELSRLVSAHNLLEVSETEQQLACQEEHSDSLQKIRNLMEDTKVRTSDILRSVCLYALRYEKSNSSELNSLKNSLLKRGGLTEQQRDFVNKICAYGGVKYREADLFLNQNAMAFTKRILKGFKGVDNIYTQHTPLVKDLVEQLIKGRLKETSFPFLGNTIKDRPQEIIVFMVGGITYEETLAIHNINKAYAGNIKVILGGTFLHNLKSFMDEVTTLVDAQKEYKTNLRANLSSAMKDA